MQAKRLNILKGKRLSPTGFDKLRFTSDGTPWAGFMLEEHATPERGHAKDWSWLKTHLVLHTRGHWQMSYRENGHSSVALLEAGAVSILPRGYELSFSWVGEMEFLVVELDDERLERFFATGQSIGHRTLIAQHGARDPQLAALLRTMELENKAGCPTGRLYAESLSLALATYVTNRYAVQPAPSREDTSVIRLSRSQRQRILDYIHSNLDRNLGLAELATLLDLSPHYLCRLFRNTFGVSPHQYVMRERVAVAKRLLAERRADIVEIAATLGFSTQSHFTEVFRRFTGTTPGRFRHDC